MDNINSSYPMSISTYLSCASQKQETYGPNFLEMSQTINILLHGSSRGLSYKEIMYNIEFINMDRHWHTTSLMPICTNHSLDWTLYNNAYLHIQYHSTIILCISVVFIGIRIVSSDNISTSMVFPCINLSLMFY